MFDLIPNLLSSFLTVLFPIFASYKALRTPDPAQLTPWLMYWVVLSCFSLAESWSWFILSWLPFYAYFRLLLLSYLVLPQTQGARLLYQSHIDPFLAHYEADIDTFITHAHDRAKAFGLSSLRRAIDFFKENVLGIPPKPSPSMAASHAYGGNTGSYAQTLLSRFNLPSARQGFGAPTAGAAADFYGLLGAALGHMGAGVGLSREAQVETISRSGALVPPGLNSTAEKMTFLATQRERLKVLLTALDREASDLSHEEMMERDVEIRSKAAGTPAQPGDGLKKSKSEAEFEAIEREEWGSEKAVTERGGDSPPTATAGGWIPWGMWG